MLKFIAWTAAFGAAGMLGGVIYAHFTPNIYESKSISSALSLSDPHPSSSAADILKQPQVQSAAAKLANGVPDGVDVAANPSNNFVQVSVRSRNPQLAAAYGKDLLASYQTVSSASNQSLLQARKTKLSSQVSQAHQKLQQVNDKIASVKQSTGILDVDSKVQQVVNYESLLTQQRDQATQDIASLQHEIQQELSQIQGLSKSQSAKVTEQANPLLKAYQSTLLELQQKKIGLLQTWLETSGPVQGVDAQINAVKKQMADAQLPQLTVESKESGPNPIRQTLAQEIANNQAQLASDQAAIIAIGHTLSTQKDESKNLPAAQAQMIGLLTLQRQAQTSFDALTNSLNSLSLTGVQGEAPTLAPVLAPSTPTEPVWPDRKLLASIGLAIGLMIGAIVGYVGLERQGPVEVFQPGPQAFPMGYQPLAIAGASTTAPPLPGRRSEGLVALSLPGGSPSESYRYMVYSLAAKHEDMCRSMLFTGVSSDDACAEAAAQFAIAMSQTGIRTLLADINLRNSELTDAFGFKGKSGISDMLGRTMLPVPANDLLLETSHEGLFFLPSGTEESDGLGGYHNLQIAGLIEDFQSKADIRIFNAAPCTVVADAPRLVRYVDDVCVVATANDEAKGLVEKARGILANAGAKSVDVIIVDAKRSKTSFFG